MEYIASLLLVLNGRYSARTGFTFHPPKCVDYGRRLMGSRTIPVQSVGKN
jgi:hypothetical protein